MLTWLDDSNKYEEVQKAYFGSYEIPYTQLTNLNIQQKLQDTGVLK